MHCCAVTGAIYALLPSVLVVIFGLKNMALNQAMSLMSDGFASLIGTPLVGEYLTVWYINNNNSNWQ